MSCQVEYTQIVRKKLISLQMYLSEEYGADQAEKIITKILKSARSLEQNPLKGPALSAMYDIETDFRYLYVNHNYLFYYTEGSKVIVAEMFHEKEDFMYRLFGIRSESKESENYWDE